MSEDWNQAWKALNNAKHKRFNWARHLHLAGLLHAAEGKYAEAMDELGTAGEREPDEAVRMRIYRAAEMLVDEVV